MCIRDSAWFASSLAARPSSLGGTGREELKTVLQQAFSTDASSNRASGIATRRFLPELQGKPSEAVVEALARTDEGYKPVSYTHLDVYKRQPSQRGMWCITRKSASSK